MAECYFQQGLSSESHAEKASGEHKEGLKESYLADARESYRKAVNADPSHSGACQKLGIEPKAPDQGVATTFFDNKDGRHKGSEHNTLDMHELLSRWLLPKVFSIAILNNRYQELREEGVIPAGQLDEEYIHLKKHAA